MTKEIQAEVKKRTREAENWLRVAEKVYHYRRDIIGQENLAALENAFAEVQKAIKSETLVAKKIQESVVELEKVLRRCGGRFYPHSGWSENVEMFLVAAILAIGIRSFFLQPFKIPTNSMYPTYNGMTYEVHEPGEEEPGAAAKAVDFVRYGTSTRRLVAPADGEVRIPLVDDPRSPAIDYADVTGRKFFVFPTPLRQYTFFVGESWEPVATTVPAEFSGFDRIVRERFFPDAPTGQRELGTWYERLTDRGVIFSSGEDRFLRLPGRYKKGETILSFDILTGDALFVDRFSYHFFRPEVGDPFVFRTRDIPGIPATNGGRVEDKYYIKRLVGAPGDVLELRPPALYANGKPIEGADAFDANRRKEGEYEGYVFPGWGGYRMLRPGHRLTVEKDSYFAMGDNSDESLDSRAWGFVPEREVVGKAVFIYHPFTRRWGLAD